MNDVKAIDLYKALQRVLSNPQLSANSRTWQGRDLQVPIFSEPKTFVGDPSQITNKAEPVITMRSVPYCENGFCRHEWVLNI